MAAGALDPPPARTRSPDDSSRQSSESSESSGPAIMAIIGVGGWGGGGTRQQPKLQAFSQGDGVPSQRGGDGVAFSERRRRSCPLREEATELPSQRGGDGVALSETRQLCRRVVRGLNPIHNWTTHDAQLSREVCCEKARSFWGRRGTLSLIGASSDWRMTTTRSHYCQ